MIDSRTIAVTPRNFHFHLNETGKRFWNGGDIARTAVFDALSTGFPKGERFFMDSVRAFADRVTCPALQAQVKAFLTQEAIHTREHVLYNQRLTANGVDVAAIEAEQEKLLARARSKLSPARQLAVTACLEHITAIFADQLMSEPAYLAGADDRFRRIWLWHALEEAEHKSVAFDVFRIAVPSSLVRYRMRCVLMIFATLMFMARWARETRLVLEGQGVRRTWRMRLAVANVMWGRPGLARRMILPWLAFFRPGFHPWAHDNRAKAARISEELAVTAG